MHRFLNCVWTWCIERVPPDKREDWEFQMYAPLPGTEKKVASQSDIDADGAAFMAALGQLG